MTNIKNKENNNLSCHTGQLKMEKLFLEFSNIDSQFHVNDENGFAFGNGYEILDAVAHARMVTESPINFGDSYSGLERVMVPKKPDEVIVDTEECIAALAEIGGMKVTKVFDDQMHFIGYTIKPQDEFINAEEAAENAEKELLGSFDCYFEEEE